METLTEQQLSNILKSRFYKKTTTTDSNIHYPIAESLIQHGELISRVPGMQEFEFNNQIYRVKNKANGFTLIDLLSHKKF